MASQSWNTYATYIRNIECFEVNACLGGRYLQLETIQNIYNRYLNAIARYK